MFHFSLSNDLCVCVCVIFFLSLYEKWRKVFFFFRTKVSEKWCKLDCLDNEPQRKFSVKIRQWIHTARIIEQNFLKLWDWCISFLLHLIVVFVRTSRERESASWRRTSPLIVILGRRVRLGAWGWKNVLERWGLHTLNKESSRFSWKRWIKAWSSSTTALISEIHYGVVNAEVAVHIFRQRSLRVNKGRKSIRP